MERWNANGTDLDNPPVEWSIQRTQEMVKDGNSSLKFHLVNHNDQGKIWIERFFVVKSNHLYQVNVRYAFAVLILVTQTIGPLLRVLWQNALRCQRRRLSRRDR
jgi:hypothetical protein